MTRAGIVDVTVLLLVVGGPLLLVVGAVTTPLAEMTVATGTMIDVTVSATVSVTVSTTVSATVSVTAPAVLMIGTETSKTTGIDVTMTGTGEMTIVRMAPMVMTGKVWYHPRHVLVALLTYSVPLDPLTSAHDELDTAE